MQMKRARFLGHVVASSLFSARNLRPAVRPCFAAIAAPPSYSSTAAGAAAFSAPFYSPTHPPSTASLRLSGGAARTFSSISTTRPPRLRLRRSIAHMSSVPPQQPKRKRTSDAGGEAADAQDGGSAGTEGATHSACPRCLGEGQTRGNRSKKARAKYKRAVESAEAAGLPKPSPPPPPMNPCKECSGSGLVEAYDPASDDDDDALKIPPADPNARVAVVGGGIGGLALALALQHRGVPCDVYERDASFDERSQGYGLTMQQGARAIRALGLGTARGIEGEGSGDDARNEDEDGKEARDGGFGIHSKRHVVHRTDGTIVGQWGMKVWGRPETKAKHASRQNAHIARQELRRMLLEKLRPGTVKWGCQLLEYTECWREDNEEEGLSRESGNHVEMTFLCQNDRGCSEKVTKKASVLVGADGIRSAVRSQKIGEDASPLKYLGCIVILGISQSPEHALTDGETVFQTADGTTRIYAMPFSKPGRETAGAANFTSSSLQDGDKEQSAGRENGGETMWQLSFPMTEADAKELSKRGPGALKDEALKRCGIWHEPVPALLKATPTALVSGYPVYDRDLLDQDVLRCGTAAPESGDKANRTSRVTLIGDAAHPMSPFKGQGANQALLDAVLLARAIYKSFILIDGMSARTKWYEKWTVEDALTDFEKNMLERSAAKVKKSAEAAEFLHSDVAIMEGNFPRCTAANVASLDPTQLCERVS